MNKEFAPGSGARGASRRKTQSLIDEAIASIEDAEESTTTLPDGVLASHLRLLKAELEELRETLAGEGAETYLTRGDSGRVIIDQWPFEYELGATILAAFQESKRLLGHSSTR